MAADRERGVGREKFKLGMDSVLVPLRVWLAQAWGSAVDLARCRICTASVLQGVLLPVIICQPQAQLLCRRRSPW